MIAGRCRLGKITIYVTNYILFIFYFDLVDLVDFMDLMDLFGSFLFF
jgi:hypothetical protein